MKNIFTLEEKPRGNKTVFFLLLLFLMKLKEKGGVGGDKNDGPPAVEISNKD